MSELDTIIEEYRRNGNHSLFRAEFTTWLLKANHEEVLIMAMALRIGRHAQNGVQ